MKMELKNEYAELTHQISEVKAMIKELDED